MLFTNKVGWNALHLKVNVVWKRKSPRKSYNLEKKVTSGFKKINFPKIDWKTKLI